MKILKRSEHPISRRDIESGALRVLNRLYRAGHTAYLVGGSVRDLFLERRPKDFDVVTSARPTQVRKLFRNCRLIGRRFRLAHVHFSGSEIVEVATFRCQPEVSGSDELLVRSDNRFGSPGEDASRRDFTINGLFYNIADYSVIDYVGGVKDIERRIVRTINDPWIRFQEDPVRMIRAIKFAGKLNFKIEKKTWEALRSLKGEIRKSPEPRVQEELARLLEEGAACRSISLLWESGLLEEIEPNLHSYLQDSAQRPNWDASGDFLFQLLDTADSLAQDGLRLGRPVLSCLWLLPFLMRHDFLSATSPDRLVRKEAERILPAVGVSRRDMERVGQLLLALRRFEQGSRRSKRSAPKALLAKSYFDESLQLYRVYLLARGDDLEPHDWWHDCWVENQKKDREVRSTESQGEERAAKSSDRSKRFRRRRSP